jgi:hypothetical protein
MGTRSRIGVMHGNKCKSVYCHWDGYLEHNGVILQEHYDSAKANHLVAMGDMSSLGSKIGEQHAFSYHELPADEVESFKTATKDMCTFYGRDRGEEGTDFKVAHTFAEFLEQVDNCGGEYYYVMEDGKWYCGSMEGEFKGRLVLLSEALAWKVVTV